MQTPSATLCQNAVVGHQYQSRAFFTIQLKKQFDNMLTGILVEIARGFIGKQNIRLRRKSAGNSDTLLLATGKLAWIVG